jgi:hypothetical protein
MIWNDVKSVVKRYPFDLNWCVYSKKRARRSSCERILVIVSTILV